MDSNASTPATQRREYTLLQNLGGHHHHHKITCKSQISLKKNIQIFTFDLLQNKTTTFYLLDANTFSYECTKVE
jgi:hypothetical protein